MRKVSKAGWDVLSFCFTLLFSKQQLYKHRVPQDNTGSCQWPYSPITKNKTLLLRVPHTSAYDVERASLNSFFLKTSVKVPETLCSCWGREDITGRVNPMNQTSKLPSEVFPSLNSGTTLFEVINCHLILFEVHS